MSSLPSEMTLSEGGPRLLILHEFRVGSTEEAATERIKLTGGEGFVSKATVHYWFCRFSSGNFSLQNEEEHQERTRKRPAEEDPCEPEAKRQRHTATGFPLDKPNDFDLKMVVKKFKFVSAVRFIQSHRNAEKIIDDSKPVWEIESLRYSGNGRTVFRPYLYPGNMHTDNFKAEKFCSAGEVTVVSLNCIASVIAKFQSSCTPTYIKEVVAPLEVLRSVGSVSISCLQRMSREDLCLVLAAAVPDVLRIVEKLYNRMPDIFQNTKNLEMFTEKSTVQSYWTTKKIFELAQNRKALKLNFGQFHKEVIEKFLENWRKGESTGSLEKLTFWMSDWNATEDADTIRTQIENMLTSFVNTPDGYILGRRDRRQIRLNFGKVIFRDFPRVRDGTSEKN